MGALLRLADKYDMDAVRSACAVFLGSKASAAAVDLSHPLESARNLLHAASLVERYLGGGGSNSGGGGGGSSSGGGSGGSTMQHDLQPYTAVMPSALQAALQPLHNQLEKSSSVHYNSYPYHKGYGASQAQPGSARAVISALQTLQANPRYNDIVAPGVQVRHACMGRSARDANRLSIIMGKRTLVSRPGAALLAAIDHAVACGVVLRSTGFTHWHSAARRHPRTCTHRVR